MITTSKCFIIEQCDDMLTGITHPDDKYGMNWIESKHALGETVCPGDVEVRKKLTLNDESIELEITFHNPNDYDLLLRKGAVGIYVPFNDSYGKASVCMTQRCHAHLNMCGSSSYIMGFRMGGEEPHLGMVLSCGELEAYSIERENKSNDRGDFILHPPFVHLLPHRDYTLKMKFFWHSDREDFYRLLKREEDFITVTSEHFTYFKGEDISVSASVETPLRTVSVTVDGMPVQHSSLGSTVTVSLDSDNVGEHTVRFCINGKSTSCKLYISESIETLLTARCSFIANKQQLCCSESALDGAYLAYDNEDGGFVYDYRRRDINSSRERICMALLILMYLKRYGSRLSSEEYARLHESLMRFTAFFKREIYDVETGTVSNDIGHENSKVRLYNYPWPTRFFLELYELEEDAEYLRDAYRIMKQYYTLGGKNFYAFTIPIVRMCELLEKGGMTEERREIMSYFAEHAEVIIANASNYPAHEVSYEQSIVAPAAEFLLQMYFLTDDERYLCEADKQIDVAELFSGEQPDYHLYMCAIRHWDGFWFGKRRLYGDTFPHYWSVLSALAFFDYARARDKKKYFAMAEDAFRGQMCQFTADGRATCATLYPLTVNGNAASYRDPWANDQDWALVYYLDYLEQKKYVK